MLVGLFALFVAAIFISAACVLKVITTGSSITDVGNRSLLLTDPGDTRDHSVSVLVTDIPEMSKGNATKAMFKSGGVSFLVADTPEVSNENGTKAIFNSGVTQILSIIGFACFEFSYDVSIAPGRAFMLVTASPSQHESVLTTGTLIGSLAGSCYSLLSYVRVPSYFGLNSDEDATAVNIMFMTVILFVVYAGSVASTLLTGYRLQSSDHSPSLEDDDTVNILDVDEGVTASNHKDSNNDSKMENNGNVCIRNNQHKHSASRNKRANEIELEEIDETQCNRIKLNVPHPTSNKDANHQRQRVDTQIIFEDEKHTYGAVSTERTDTLKKKFSIKSLFQKFDLDVALCVLLLAHFFIFGSYVCITMFLSNLLVIGILHGDPMARNGDPALKRYNEGLKMASLGVIVLYSAYTLMSLCNKRLLQKLGPATEFLIGCVLLLLANVLLVLMPSLGAYFFTTMVGGMVKTVGNTVAFLQVNAHRTPTMAYQDLESSHDPNATPKNTGLRSSLVALMFTLDIFLIAGSLGPLMEATGTPWVSAYTSIVFSALALVCMLAYLYMTKKTSAH